MDPLSLPGNFSRKPTWAKCDMIATVGLFRLDRVMLKNRFGQRTYVSPKITDDDLNAILRGVLCSINLKDLTSLVT